MPKPDLLRTEQEHHRQAFEVYVALGAKRSYPRVAQQLGVSASTVKLWNRSFGWSQRLSEREANESRQIADRILASGSEVINRNLKIVRAAILHSARDIAQGRNPPSGDLDRLIRLEEHLMASHSESSSGRFEGMSPNQLRDEAIGMLTALLQEYPGGRETLRALLEADSPEVPQP